jgi:hypothetical protein
MGIVAGAPLGGLVERDEHDKYGLARELIHPLLPWFRKVNYHGPIQVTAIKCDGRDALPRVQADRQGGPTFGMGMKDRK